MMIEIQNKVAELKAQGVHSIMTQFCDLHAFDKYTETKTTWIRIDSPV